LTSGVAVRLIRFDGVHRDQHGPCPEEAHPDPDVPLLAVTVYELSLGVASALLRYLLFVYANIVALQNGLHHLTACFP
jgi:hypothetical protein